MCMICDTTGLSIQFDLHVVQKDVTGDREVDVMDAMQLSSATRLELRQPNTTESSLIDCL